ncbi:aminotransferase class V-fold PLP-dependent enzyme [Amnibacterium sp.]|uniref:aminotransferase class V-fold PLP-dependent enzyme n=1 Tax=Amnibacterium sp. TaxID=1872496 RepID=UPI002622BCFD|nr:aminotransferase class V-fold PLP-dependent enzyme [Amnibacterium sp.]MCU1472586.1 hypothetical protein [Amnibacterium sp.]
MTTIEEFAAGFDEEPGYLDYAAFGPFSRAVAVETDWQREVLTRARFGSTGAVLEQAPRARAAVADLLGFRADQIVLQPDTSTALMHAVFGLTGGVLMSPGEYPSLSFAAVRAEQSLSVTAPIWLETDHGRVTPGLVREQLTSTTTAVAVSAVDARTGFVADLEGLRQVIGDRLLIVDAVQALGAVDLPWTAADVVACGGQKWLRAGYGTGFLAVSDRAANRLTPVLSGTGGFPEGLVWDAVPEPAEGAAGLQLGSADQSAAGRLAAALEDLAEAGVPAVAARIAGHVSRIIELADEVAAPVVSPRTRAERAGIVVLGPRPDQLTALTAALFNHGVSVTIRGGAVRIAPHAGTTEETLGLLRSALLAYATALRPVGR